VQLYSSLQDEISFASIGVTIKVADIYRRVKTVATSKQEEPNKAESE
jgi:hypothetical protein